MNGIINIYKEKGYTSHDVVAKLRGILKQKKIGHTGTLDPDAIGVLPVCLGNATKVCDLLTDKDKTYETVLKLGIETDTQDMTGNILEKKEVAATEENIVHVIQSFIGEYNQVPPMYSALKVNGKKLYELAREGKVIERKPRQVVIYDIVIKNINMQDKEVAFSVSCSKGTYIRTLCHDIGERLGCGGCMKTLIRTKAGMFEIADSITLEQVADMQKKETLAEKILAVDAVFSEKEKIVVAEQAITLLQNGNPLKEQNLQEIPPILADAMQFRVYDDKNIFRAVYEYRQKDKKFWPIKMFLA